MSFFYNKVLLSPSYEWVAGWSHQDDANVGALSRQAGHSATSISQISFGKEKTMLLSLPYVYSDTISTLYMDTLSKPQGSFAHLKTECLFHYVCL